MKHIFLVTGNPNKLNEWRGVLPTDITMDTLDLDLVEIQTSDPAELVEDKVKRAYEAVQKPVVVEDVSVNLHKLNGLPGPFIKFFLKAMGSDALFRLAGKEGEKATVTCSIAYYDGKDLLVVHADVNGSIVAPRGKEGFGFDVTFVPEGETLTYAEMNSEKKNLVSHRQKAIKLFVEKISE
jgi:inosine triphosphate pyrophosphatase